MSGILQELVGTTGSAGYTPMVPSLTIGAKTFTYSAGLIFEYYDSVVTSPAADVNITVNQDRACTIVLSGAGGDSPNVFAQGSLGGGSHAMAFTFTFKAGVTYVLKLGAVKGGGASGEGLNLSNGGGYSALYKDSNSTSNIIALVAGGGAGGYHDSVAYTTGTAGYAGSVGPTAVTNGVAFTGIAGLPAPAGGGAATTSAGGTAGTTTYPGGNGGAFTGGTGNQRNTWVGGGGGGGYWGGAGGGTNSTSTAGGGGAGSSFLYTAADSSGKTAVYSSNTSGSSASSFVGNAGRPGFMGRAGCAGTNVATGAQLQWWSSFGSWRRPYPGGTAGIAASYNTVLGAAVANGATSMQLAYAVPTNSLSGAATSILNFGADCRRLTTGPNVVEFTVGGTTYTKVVSSVSTGTITTTTTLGVDVPAGTTVYMYPVKSTVATTIGAINISTAFDTSTTSIWRVAEPSGAYVYGWLGTAASWTGGGTTPLTVTLPLPIYPGVTLPKGSIVQRSSDANNDTGASYGTSRMFGACPGSIRITMT